VSWAFNEGNGNVGSSTLIARLNAGEDPNTVAEEELPKWDIAGGQVLQGLVRRRAAEVALFQTPTSEGALPACG
jgi:lysozyme